MYQSLSYNTTASVVVKLMLNSPERVVSKNLQNEPKMNLSLLCLLCSSIAPIALDAKRWDSIWARP